MFRHLLRLAALLVALQISGGHWTVLQSVAWMGMVVAYAQEDSSVSGAVAKTFDGQHPCGLCEVVKSGREADREQETEKRVIKVEVVLLEHRPVLLPRIVVTALGEREPPLPGRVQGGVPTPPPRIG